MCVYIYINSVCTRDTRTRTRVRAHAYAKRMSACVLSAACLPAIEAKETCYRGKRDLLWACVLTAACVQLAECVLTAACVSACSISSVCSLSLSAACVLLVTVRLFWHYIRSLLTLY
jgi:hypothetical protein